MDAVTNGFNFGGGVRLGGWDDARIELLKKLYADGLSASQIATELGGVTRNGVIGKVHRLGLPGRGHKIVKASIPKKRSHAPRSKEQANTRPRITPELIPIEALPVDDVGGDHPHKIASLLDLKNEHCRFPYGEPRDSNFHFCGIPQADFAVGISYCKGHRRLTGRAAIDTRRSTWRSVR